MDGPTGGRTGPRPWLVAGEPSPQTPLPLQRRRALPDPQVINRTELARVCDSLSLLDITLPPVEVAGGPRDGGGDGEGDGNGDGGAAPSAKRQRLAPRPSVRVRAPRSTTVSSFSREAVEAAGERLGERRGGSEEG